METTILVEFLKEKGMYESFLKAVNKFTLKTLTSFCYNLPINSYFNVLGNFQDYWKQYTVEWCRYVTKRKQEIFYQFLVEEGILFSYTESISRFNLTLDKVLSNYSPSGYLHKSTVVHHIRLKWYQTIKKYGLE